MVETVDGRLSWKKCVMATCHREIYVLVRFNPSPARTQDHSAREFLLRNCLNEVCLLTCLWEITLVVS